MSAQNYFIKLFSDSVVIGTLRKVRVEQIPLSSSSASSDKPLEDATEKQTRPNSDMAVNKLCSTGAGVAKETALRSEVICQALPQRGNIDQVKNSSASAPISSLPNSGPNSVKTELSSSSLSSQSPTSLSDSDRKENEVSPVLKSILILPSEENFIQPKPTGLSKPSKKVTMSNDVQIINGQIDETSDYSRLDEEFTKKSETVGTKQSKGRQTQSRVVSVSSEGELVSKDDCKMQ